MRRFDQAGADGVLDDVTRDRERGLIVAEHMIVKARLPQPHSVALREFVTGTLLRLVHEFRHVRSNAATLSEKVDMIAHQAVHVYDDVECGRGTQNLPQYHIAYVLRHEYATPVRRAER